MKKLTRLIRPPFNKIRWMKRRALLAGLASLILAAFFALGLLFKPKIFHEEKRDKMTMEEKLKLPEPAYKSSVSIEEAILLRRSIRDYKPEPITLNQLSQILWAAQGITERSKGFRSAPSAGATYPLEIYVVIKEGGVEELPAGIYHYLPNSHEIELTKTGDYSRALMKAALDQRWVGEAALNLVINAVYKRTTRIYGDRGMRYVHMEVGHVGQNVYLQCISLNLACVVIGAFYDEEVKQIVSGVGDPLYIIPIGVKEKPWITSSASGP